MPTTRAQECELSVQTARLIILGEGPPCVRAASGGVISRALAPIPSSRWNFGVRRCPARVTEDLRRCFQIMECDDRRLLDQSMANWNDITDFEVIPVITSAEATAAVSLRL